MAVKHHFYAVCFVLFLSKLGVVYAESLCSRGHYMDSGTETCTPCPPGSYTTGNNKAPECAPCKDSCAEPGKEELNRTCTWVTDNTCVCKQGYYNAEPMSENPNCVKRNGLSEEEEVDVEEEKEEEIEINRGDGIAGWKIIVSSVVGGALLIGITTVAVVCFVCRNRRESTGSDKKSTTDSVHVV